MTGEPADKTDTTDETGNAGPALNEWGIPDWRDPAAYGECQKWSYLRWHWEFFRRRDDIRRHYSLCLEIEARLASEFGPNQLFAADNDPPREGDIRRLALAKSDQVDLGFRHLLDPRRGDYPDAALRDAFWAFDNIIGEFHSPGQPVMRVIDRLRLADNGLAEAAQANLDEDFLNAVPFPNLRVDDEVVVSFDLRRPLLPQLENARIFLESCYARSGKPTQRRRHPAKWLGYLRTLDARDAGASWREIAAIHTLTAGTEQAARDIWKAADALRINF